MKITRYKFWALHGFLGQPSDWDFLRAQYDIETPVISRSLSLDNWAKEFNRSVKKSSQKNILVGYSMGGRLALHSALNDPSLWDGAIIISAHPGLKSAHAERRAQDEVWAKRFETDNWGSLISDWNTQASLKSVFVSRSESHYDRSILANQLRHFSLGTQNYIDNIPVPHVWLVGQDDNKLIDATKACPSRKIISGSHRLLWENPSGILDAIKHFLASHRIHAQDPCC